MVMIGIRILAFIFLTSTLVSCHFVKTLVPFGLRQAELVADDYNGTWESEDGDTVEITVLDKTKGEIELSYSEGSREAGPLKHRKMKVYLLDGKKWQYASVPADDDGSDKEGFMFGCIEATSKRIIIWAPRVEKFIQLIEAGKIEGEVVKDGVVLDRISPELIDVIESEENGFVFDWREPMILMKQKAPASGVKKVKQ